MPNAASRRPRSSGVRMCREPQRTTRQPVTPRISSSLCFSAITASAAVGIVRSSASRYLSSPSNSPKAHDRGNPKSAKYRAVGAHDGDLQIDVSEPESMQLEAAHALAGKLGPPVREDSDPSRAPHTPESRHAQAFDFGPPGGDGIRVDLMPVDRDHP